MQLFDYEQSHVNTLRASLAECTVLLKKDGQFPLSGPCKIAAFGSGVRHTIKGGTGSGEVNSRYFVSIEQGLKDAGFQIVTDAWLNGYDQVRAEAKVRFVKEIKARARAKFTLAVLEGMGAVMPEPEYSLPLDADADCAIYVLSRISGEGNDRQVTPGDVKLSETEKRDILALNAKFQKFMLVINAGGPVDLSEVSEVRNILYLSQLGVETGSALADILLGKASPSGKLTTTWAAWEDYCPVGDFGDKNETRYTEGIYVGYRYFDSVGKRALYPFGFGLTYSEFDITPVDVTAQGEQITVTARITNIGIFSAKEVAQVYVSVPEGKLDQPYQALAAFAKTDTLAPGESQELNLTFSLSDLSSYDAARAAYILEPGNYIIRLGNSSVHTQSVALAVLDSEVLVRQVKSLCGNPDFEDWKPAKLPQEQIAADIRVLPIHAADIPTETVVYDTDQPIDDYVQTLTDEQLAYLNVGAFNPKGGLTSIIGNASSSVSGAAGESAGILKDQGFPYMVMADGPAGLRLTQESFADEKGVHAIGTAGLPESMAAFLPGPVRYIMNLANGNGAKPKDDQPIIYQYATAIPIGTALAQTWNVDFARACGDIVGDEMERFGIHLWLAPALNIHRSILCGRNFEYFSEDPLISGKFASALTLGVQAHPTCGTTIKHYAANNQETNRYGSNSQVSQRALREIYLRGFDICVKESQPCSVMTSYNLLNGEHTSESRDLIEDILRSEYGFQGIVMTDWIVAAMPMDKDATHRKPKAHLIAAAGSELVMPGGKSDVKDILKGLRSGALSREQLQRNATRVYRMAKRLNNQ